MGFEPAIPASERPQTHALDRTATGTDTQIHFFLKILLLSKVIRVYEFTEDFLPSNGTFILQVLPLFPFSLPFFAACHFLSLSPNRPWARTERSQNWCLVCIQNFCLCGVRLGIDRLRAVVVKRAARAAQVPYGGKKHTYKGT